MTTNPIWILVPWAVFAVAAGVKFWRLTAQFRKTLLGVPTKTEHFREALLRIWTGPLFYRLTGVARFSMPELSTVLMQ